MTYHLLCPPASLDTTPALGSNQALSAPSLFLSRNELAALARPAGATPPHKGTEPGAELGRDMGADMGERVLAVTQWLLLLLAVYACVAAVLAA